MYIFAKVGTKDFFTHIIACEEREQIEEREKGAWVQENGGVSQEWEGFIYVHEYSSFERRIVHTIKSQKSNIQVISDRHKI